VLAGHGADPRELSIIAYGGNGAVHAWAIASELGIDRIYVPKAAPAFSALGVLVADYVVDMVRAYVVPLSQVDLARLRSLMTELSDEARKELDPTGLPDGQINVRLYAQMCYPGQNFDMSVPMPTRPLDDAGLLELAERFHALHETDRGFAFPTQQPLLRGLRLVARGLTGKPDDLTRRAAAGDAGPAAAGGARAAQRERRPVYFGRQQLDTPVYDGTALRAGAEVRGPALVEEPFTVVVVPPGARAELDRHGNYELTPGEA
jgi:N-methylhydantoinase A